MEDLSAIPAGASRNGVLSEPCPLIGESSVKGAGVLDGSDEEYRGNSTSEPLSTRSDLVGCNPAGIAEDLLFLRIDLLCN